MSELKLIIEELVALEPIFHRPEVASTREDFEKIIDENFTEISASGKKYEREEVIDTLVRRKKSINESGWETKNFDCIKLSDNTFLLTYTLVQGARVSYRVTVWCKSNNFWKVVYHQGTLSENSR